MSAYIYDGLRTPFGRHAGNLAAVRPDDLLAGVVRALAARNPFAASDYEDLIAGCASQAGEDGRNLGRHTALLAGLPVAVGGITVNRLCGSGLAAVLDAARAVRCDEGELFIASGAESMSRAPFVIGKAESAFCGCSIRPSVHASPTRASRATSVPTRCPRPPTTSPASWVSAASRRMPSPHAARHSTKRPAPRASFTASCIRLKCRRVASSRH